MQRLKLSDHKLHHCIRRIVQCPHCKAELEQRETEVSLARIKLLKLIPGSIPTASFHCLSKSPLPCELVCGRRVNRENVTLNSIYRLCMHSMLYLLV